MRQIDAYHRAWNCLLYTSPVGHALYDAGFRLIEVPLNSPDPLASIRAMRDALPADCLVGAVTVLNLSLIHIYAGPGQCLP